MLQQHRAIQLIARNFDQPKRQWRFVADNPRRLAFSQMFLIAEGLSHYVRNNPNSIVRRLCQGDGGLSLPGISKLEQCNALMDFLPDEHSSQYLKHPHGREDLRRAIYHNFYGFPEEPGQPVLDRLIVTPGGREAIFRWAMSITKGIGEYVIVSAAPWPSYGQLFYYAKKNVLMAPGLASQSFRITPQGIDACLRKAAQQGKPVAGLVITSPGNPTGYYHSEDELVELIEYAVKRGIQNIFLDIIYQMVIDETQVPRYNLPRLFARLSAKARRAVTVMGGIAKDIGGSSLRIAHLLTENKELSRTLRAVPSHVAMPDALGQAVALKFYSDPDPWNHKWRLQVSEPTNQSRVLAKQMLEAHGLQVVCGQGYYVFVNIAPWLGRKGVHGKVVNDVRALSLYLSHYFGVSIVPGGDFRQPHWVRISVAVDPGYIYEGLQLFFAGGDSLLAA